MNKLPDRRYCLRSNTPPVFSWAIAIHCGDAVAVGSVQCADVAPQRPISLDSRRVSTTGSCIQRGLGRPSHARSSFVVCGMPAGHDGSEGRKRTAYPVQSRLVEVPYHKKDADKQYNPALALALLLPRRRKAFHWLGSAWLACVSPSTVLSIYHDHVFSLLRV